MKSRSALGTKTPAPKRKKKAFGNPTDDEPPSKVAKPTASTAKRKANQAQPKKARGTTKTRPVVEDDLDADDDEAEEEPLNAADQTIADNAAGLLQLQDPNLRNTILLQTPSTGPVSAALQLLLLLHTTTSQVSPSIICCVLLFASSCFQWPQAQANKDAAQDVLSTVFSSRALAAFDSPRANAYATLSFTCPALACLATTYKNISTPLDCEIFRHRQVKTGRYALYRNRRLKPQTLTHVSCRPHGSPRRTLSNY